MELATQIADVRLEDYKINFPLRGGGGEKKVWRRKEGERERERGKEEKEGEKGSAVSCDAAVITTS